MSLASAIEAAQPELIIPGDDLSTQHLHHLHRRESRRGRKGARICTLIERSFGSPESFPIVYERATFMRIAGEEGVRVPKTAGLENVTDLQRCISQTGFPLVLKADGTSGGTGVRIVHSLEEATRAFRTLQAPPLLARAVKRALLDRDRTLIMPSLLRRRNLVSAQSFVEGHEATSTVACWKGAVLAALHFEVIKKRSASGPATVMRLIDHPEMAVAVEKMVRRLNLSGLLGFDFMVDAGNSDAFLIEINPRTTQVGHIALGTGRDLPAALFAAMSGVSVPSATKVTDNDLIALFPQEWMRDTGSPFLQSGYHDVPWDEPELVRACVQHAQKHGVSTTKQNWESSFSALCAARKRTAKERTAGQPIERVLRSTSDLHGAGESEWKAQCW